MSGSYISGRTCFEAGMPCCTRLHLRVANDEFSTLGDGLHTRSICSRSGTDMARH